MSMTDEQFDDYLDYCYEKLEKKQEKLFQDFQIGNYEKYWYNQERSVLQFIDNGVIQLEFKVIFIGSWSKKSDTWMWAWANGSMLEEVRQLSSSIQGLYQVTDFDIFKEPIFECDEAMAHELTAFAVEQLDVRGMYISPDGNSLLFMAIIEPTETF